MKIPFIVDKMTYEKVLKILLEDKWSELSTNIQIDAVETIFEYEKDILFKDKNFSISLQIYSNDFDKNYGKYDNKKQELYININEAYFNSYYPKYTVYETICHELYHAYVDYLVKNNLIDKRESELLEFYINGVNKHFNFLNFNNEGNFHINKMHYATDIIELLSSIFYHLNISERQSFVYEYERSSLIFPDTFDDIIQDYCEYFNDYYNISLPEEEIYELIDKCFYNLSQSICPETDLEASIMYDISCLALLNNDKITELECESMLKNNYKKAQLAEYGYCLNEEDRYGDYIITNSLDSQIDKYINSVADFKKLTRFEQRDNPKLILLAIINLQDKLKDNIYTEILDYLFTYAVAKQEYLYSIHLEKLSEWYPDKYREYFGDIEKDEYE